MKVIKISPRGYCHGVVNAIKTVKKAINNDKYPRPIYVLGMIVHNKNIIKSLERMDVITIQDKFKSREELLDEVQKGTIIFTAHGVSPAVYEKAKQKGLTIIDATCKDVHKSHKIVKEYIDKNYDIIYIGKKNHPEGEGVIGISNKVHLIENINDLDNYDIKNNKIAITNQTTMSIIDIKNIVSDILKRYPRAVFLDEICSSTRIRQEAIINKNDKSDLCLIVGDKSSNNSNKLVEISKKIANTSSYLIESVEDIDINWLKDIDSVSVSSGASTPTKITKEVINFLSNFDKNDKSTWDNKSKIKYNEIV